MRAFVALGVLLLAARPALALNDALGDLDLASRAGAVLAAKETPADRILGLHKGVPVVVDTRCAGSCPASTIRIIHYLGGVDTACLNTHGDIVNVDVPRGMSMGPEKFCVPHILVSRHMYTDKPYSK